MNFGEIWACIHAMGRRGGEQGACPPAEGQEGPFTCSSSHASRRNTQGVLARSGLGLAAASCCLHGEG